MNSDVPLVETLKRRFEIAGALSHLHARHLHHQQMKGGLEIELAQIRESLIQNGPSVIPPASVEQMEARLSDAAAALNACREEIAICESELDAIDRQIGRANTQTMEV